MKQIPTKGSNAFTHRSVLPLQDDEPMNKHRIKLIDMTKMVIFIPSCNASNVAWRTAVVDDSTKCS